MLRRLRQEKGFSLSELANRIGYAKSYLSVVETGKETANPNILQAYEAALELIPGTLTRPKYETPGIIRTLSRALYTGTSSLEGEAALLSSDSVLPPDTGNDVRGLKGLRGVILEACTLLNKASNDPPRAGEEILFTFQSPHDAFDLAPDLKAQWHTALRRVLVKGWDVVHLWRLTGDMDKRSALIADIMALQHGLPEQYQPYYFPVEQGQLPAPQDVLIVPGHGALLFLGTSQAQYVDAAIFLPEGEQVQVLRSYFATLRAHAKPLLKVYPHDSAQFDDDLLDAEMQAGELFMVKDGLSTLMMPLSIVSDLIRRILQSKPSSLYAGQNEDSIKQRLRALLENRTRRLQRFQERVKGSKVYHIASKSMLRKLLSEGRISADDWLTTKGAGDARLTRTELAACLRQTIYYLHKYDNYELGLVDEAPDEVFEVFWEMSNIHTVLLETRRRDDESMMKEMDFAIHEPLVVSAFQDYFLRLWDELPVASKDKPTVIKWLAEQLAELT
jgi:transcriptional regulator with XRE-family HTH domain